MGDGRGCNLGEFGCGRRHLVMIGWKTHAMHLDVVETGEVGGISCSRAEWGLLNRLR